MSPTVADSWRLARYVGAGVSTEIKKMGCAGGRGEREINKKAGRERGGVKVWRHVLSVRTTCWVCRDIRLSSLNLFSSTLFSSYGWRCDHTQDSSKNW